MKSRFVQTVWVVFFSVLSSTAFAQKPVPAPMLELEDLQGRKLRLADYKGKVVLINFWATWCPPCRKEVPELVRWQREYGNRGLQIIGITYPPQTRSEVQRFALKSRINYPVALGTEATKILFTASEALPVTVVVNAEGNVEEVIEGIVFPDEFDAKIKPLLVNQTGAMGSRRTQPQRPKSDDHRKRRRVSTHELQTDSRCTGAACFHSKSRRRMRH